MAHHSLREVRGNTMRSSSFNQVNMILAEVNDVRKSVFSAISEVLESINDKDQPPAKNQQINRMTTTAEQVQHENLKAIKDLQLELKDLKNKSPTNPTNPTKQGKYTTRTKTSKYTAMGLVRTKVNSEKVNTLATRTTQPPRTR